MSERTWEEEFAQRSSRAVAREICCSTCSSMRLPPLAQPWHWSRCICFAEGSRDSRARARARPRKARPPVASTFIMRTSAVCRDTTTSLLSATFCARDKIILLRKWAASRFCDRGKPIRKRQLKRCRVYATRHFLSLCRHSISLVRFFSPPPLILAPLSHINGNCTKIYPFYKHRISFMPSSTSIARWFNCFANLAAWI